MTHVRMCMCKAADIPLTKIHVATDHTKQWTITMGRTPHVLFRKCSTYDGCLGPTNGMCMHVHLVTPCANTCGPRRRFSPITALAGPKECASRRFQVDGGA